MAPATVYATPEADAELARDLPGHTAHQIGAFARAHRVRTKRDSQRTQAKTRFGWRHDGDLDGYRYSGFLPAEQGARLNATLEREADRVGPDAETGQWAPFPERAAHALVALADQTVADDQDPQGAVVVVHVDAEVLDGTLAGNGTIDDLPVGRESILRLLCDSQVEFNLDSADGRTVGIGRSSQAVPRWLRRRVGQRDGCCRFPGCERAIRHRHHIHWWSRGGPTNANNLVGLCWWHHHCVHEGGWTITGNPDNEITFTSPYGRELHSKPTHSEATSANAPSVTRPTPQPRPEHDSRRSPHPWTLLNPSQSRWVAASHCMERPVHNAASNVKRGHLDRRRPRRRSTT